MIFLVVIELFVVLVDFVIVLIFFVDSVVYWKGFIDVMCWVIWLVFVVLVGYLLVGYRWLVKV